MKPGVVSLSLKEKANILERSFEISLAYGERILFNILARYRCYRKTDKRNWEW